MSEAPFRRRHGSILVAPIVTFAAVAAGLLAAHYYDRLPLKPPGCGFRSAFGIPCVSCGGTRSIRSLASGRVGEAIAYNPAVPFGALVSLFWLVLSINRYLAGTAPHSTFEQNIRIKRVAIAALFLLVLNWIYLIIFLK